MENKKTAKWAKSLVAILGVVFVLCVTCLNAFALPSMGKPYYSPLPVDLNRLSSRHGGTQVGQFYYVPDAFCSNANWSAYVAQSDTISSSDTLTTAYRSSYEEYTWTRPSTTDIYHGYVSINGNNPNVSGSSYGSIPVMSMPNTDGYYDPTEDQLFYDNGYLLRIRNAYYSLDNDMCFWINYQANNNVRWCWSCIVTGFDEIGEPYTKTYYGRITERGSDFARVSISEMLSHNVVNGDENLSFWFGDAVSPVLYIEDLRIFPFFTGDSSTPPQLLYFNWLRGYANHYEDYAQQQSRWASEYSYGLSVYLQRNVTADDTTITAFRYNWLEWLGNTAQGVLGVRIFGDDIPFTLGGLAGVMVALGIVLAVIRGLRK